MAGDPSDKNFDRVRRFRDAALPYLDDVYTLARYLLRDATDAEDAVQECYLRALTHFDTFHGTAIKPWLFAILRNVCRSEFARRSGVILRADAADAGETGDGAEPMWCETPNSPETQLLHQLDAATTRRLVETLPKPFREVIVLREINDLSYREIADVIGAPIGTVMSRLARARSMLRAAWTREKDEP
ncbi:MAG: sigma-70 family RNA polymerase sigma factor [Xanthobacteraceae bacterium]|nr:MAG: sigma-70 family RNA polymerase sigma factor [Xanthobacteraceae bacterium]